MGLQRKMGTGIKPRPGSHRRENHEVLKQVEREGGPQGFGGEERGSGSFGEVKRGPCGSEGE